jgi:hypothetical protein
VIEMTTAVLFDARIDGEAPLLSTSGHGLWGKRKQDIKVTKIVAKMFDPEEDFGELRVYFSKRSWSTEKDGLIYTDPLFLRQLHAFLRTLGLRATDVSVDYSEQGMQGDDYVSLDFNKLFINKMRQNGYLRPLKMAA